MAILGQAIARHLINLRGLYSVEFPERLAAEGIALVQACNTVRANHAIFVADDVSAIEGITPVRWRAILGWRTEDDRIFVWKRGIREPDTSFRSVVRPFISSRFPGVNGGECTPELFVRICVAELWSKRNWPTIGDSFEAFVRTGNWLHGVLHRVFEHGGASPGNHWSDLFVEHWAQMLEALDRSLQTLNGSIEPRHAWELVRLSGIPLPSAIVNGNPFLGAPEELNEKEWDKLRDLWEDVVQSFILPEGEIASFLTALDKQALAASGNSPWRGLDWSLVRNLPSNIPSVRVGFQIFTTSPSPSLLASIPSYPVAPVPSWWGVSTNDLDEARRSLREQTALIPDDTTNALLRLFPSDPTPYFLNTRVGTVSFAHTAKKWRARVNIPGVNLKFKEDWQHLFVDGMKPEHATDGDAWINPDAVEIKFTGLKQESVDLTRSAGEQLSINFTAVVEYAASKETTKLTGKWTCERSLKVKLRVHRRFHGQWDEGREVETDISVIVPSPFAPTIVVTSNGRLEACTPDNQDEFQSDEVSGSAWKVVATPTVMMREEGTYDVHVYDGSLSTSTPQWAPIAQPIIDGNSFNANASGLFSPRACNLDDSVLIEDPSISSGRELVVFNVKERSGSLSSGLLSAVRGMAAGRRQPASIARESIFGRYQDSVIEAIRRVGPLPNSLYQYVLPATSSPVEWRNHPGTPNPVFLIDVPASFGLPGIGNAPSMEMVGCPQWKTFMQACKELYDALGLTPESEGIWLSGIDFSILSGQVVKDYIAAHTELVRWAKKNSARDFFWASYPFCVFIVESRTGVGFGQLQAVMISPLHPARLGWGFSVAKAARVSDADSALLSLTEGWNFPYCGSTLNAAEQSRPLVAVPIDPGSEQDFLSWSALAVLNDRGIAELPVLAAGQLLPWGGRTGINARVVERAVSDYLSVHPHINSFEVDIRSVASAPRSREIDAAVIQLIGGAQIKGIESLGGGTRVWDNEERQGSGPTRDTLFAARSNVDTDRPFEWRKYPSSAPPKDTDVAFIENASVHLAQIDGTAEGVLGLLPIRRFSPSWIQGTMFDQNFSPASGEDLLGLSTLLREIETPNATVLGALRATPQTQALGIGGSALWEVLGTFNLDPALLASLVGLASQGSSSKRLLWEWRPSWMPVDRKLADLARRPYYVVAQIPASLLEALQRRQGFSKQNAEELLSVLGLRGIGLAALNAEGGTEESAAAGFFYALQLFLPPNGNSIFGCSGKPLFSVVPLDPLEGLLQALAGRPLTRRADLLALAISKESTGAIKICFVPVEVKHHGMPSIPEALPTPSEAELKRARQQLVETSKLLTEIGDAINTGGANPFGCYLRRLGLATLVDLSLSFVTTPVSAADRSEIIKALLGGRVSFGVGDPLLLWFAPGSLQLMGAASVINPYGVTKIDSVHINEIFVDPTAVSGFWWTGQTLTSNETATWDKISDTIRSSFQKCTGTGSGSSTLKDDLRRAIGLGSASVALTVTIPAPENPATVTSGDGAKETNTTQISESKYTVTAPVQSVQVPLPTPALPKPAATEDTRNTPVPRVFLGWSSATSRWALVGKLHGNNEGVALDLDHPKTIGIFGYMGSGKSYLLGNIIESAAQSIEGINQLSNPLAVVVFNYRRNAADRFELSSLSIPNQNDRDIDRLRSEYNAGPRALRDTHVLCLPGELTPERRSEYGEMEATELFFNPHTLGAEDWELLMGEPGSEAVFARTIRNTLVDLRSKGAIDFDSFEENVAERLTGQSRTAAALRFDFVRRYISGEQGCDFSRLLKPGRVLTIDLRQPLFNKEDALRFFLVCANQISRVQGSFNKMVIFDEAHEYLSDVFGERMESRIRLMRHEGTSYVFATQDVGSIPPQISRFLTTRFVFDLGTRENVNDLEKVAPDFRGFQLAGMQPGRCFVQSNQSTSGIFGRPREVIIRPRVTQHGGQSRIFSTPH